MDQVHLVVKGRVQGVFFRRSTQEKAKELKLVGWVKNLKDGNVEILAQGDKNKLEELVAWANEGPAESHVREVQTLWQPCTKEHDDFEIV